MKQVDEHYKYIARYVDDVIVFSKDPMVIMEELKKTYIMKGVGKPQYYLGGDVVELGPEWEKEGISSAFSAETYIKNSLPKLAKLCGLDDFKKWSTHLLLSTMLKWMRLPYCHLSRFHCINLY